MDHLYIQTPILEDTFLSKEMGVTIYLKMEALQPSGSYKNRGAGVLLSDYLSRGKNSFVIAASGNTALSFAYAAKVLRCSLTVILPKETSHLMQAKIALEGALIVEAKDLDEATKKAKEIALKEEKTFVNAFEYPLFFEGISTLIYEVYGAGLKPNAIILPVLNGDLLMSVILGLISCKWTDIPIITAEPESDCPFATALFAGEKEAKGIVKEIFTHLEKIKIYPQIVTSKAVLHAAKKFADERRVLIEPKSAAALALAYQSLPLLKTFPSSLIIVSGGANVTLSSFK